MNALKFSVVTTILEEVIIYTNLNETINGELKAKHVEFKIPWWLKLFGLKPKHMINKIIETDYTNYAVIYFCNEFNTWFEHDEVYFLLRNLSKSYQFMDEAYKIVDKIGFDSKKMKKIDQDSNICQQLSP